MARRLLRQLGAIAVLAMLVALAVTASATAAGGVRGAKAKRRALAGSTGLAATGLDNAHVKLQWGAVHGASAYRIVRGGLLIGQTAGTSYTDSLLWPRTTYAYEVDALSATGAKLKALAGQGTTAALPTAGFPRPFPAASIWNSPVGSTPVAANSSALISYFLAHSPHPNMTLRAWGVSVSETHATDSMFSVPCTRYLNCTLDAFGVFAIPATAAPDPSADGYLAVVDPSSLREWDMWQAQSAAGSWSASAGAAVSTNGNGTAPEGTASGDAANLPLLGGIVRPEEILQGHIDHALVFGMADVSDLGHVCPATHNDGSSSDPSALMEGTRLQLDPSLNVDALQIPAWEKPVARAMQVYGMYLRDQGGSFAIYAENPVGRGYDAWSKAGLPGGDNAPLTGIPWNKLRVVSAPSC